MRRDCIFPQTTGERRADGAASSSAVAGPSTERSANAPAEGRSLPGLRRNTAQVGRRRLGDLRACSGTLLRDPAGAGEARLWELRQDRASESAEPADRAWNRWARAFGPCAGLEVCGSSSLVRTFYKREG